MRAAEHKQKERQKHDKASKGERKTGKDKHREGRARWWRPSHKVTFTKAEKQFAPLREEERKDLAPIPPRRMDAVNQAILEKVQEIKVIKQIPPKERGKKGTTKVVQREVGGVVHKIDLNINRLSPRLEEREALTLVPYNPMDAKIPQAMVRHTDPAKLEAAVHTHPGHEGVKIRYNPGYKESAEIPFGVGIIHLKDRRELRQGIKLENQLWQMLHLDRPSAQDVLMTLQTRDNLPHHIITPNTNITLTPAKAHSVAGMSPKKVDKLIERADQIALKKALKMAPKEKTIKDLEDLIQNFQAIRAQTIPAALGREYNLRVEILPKGVPLSVAGPPPETMPHLLQKERAEQRRLRRSQHWKGKVNVSPRKYDRVMAQIERARAKDPATLARVLDKIGMPPDEITAKIAAFAGDPTKKDQFYEVMSTYLPPPETRRERKTREQQQSEWMAAAQEVEARWHQRQYDKMERRFKRGRKGKSKGRTPRSQRDFNAALEEKFGDFALEGLNADYDDTLTPEENWNALQKELQREAMAGEGAMIGGVGQPQVERRMTRKERKERKRTHD